MSDHFPPSKYSRWYSQIVEGARSRPAFGYVEKHHVLPRSLGGTDDPRNLVDLTAREHFLVHWLLTRMVTGPARFKMLRALSAMSTTNKGLRNFSAKYYEISRKAFSEAQRGVPKTEKQKRAISKKLTGRKRAKHECLAVSRGMMGRVVSEETRNLISKKAKERTDDISQKSKDYWSRVSDEDYASISEKIRLKKLNVPRPDLYVGTWITPWGSFSCVNEIIKALPDLNLNPKNLQRWCRTPERKIYTPKFPEWRGKSAREIGFSFKATK